MKHYISVVTKPSIACFYLGEALVLYMMMWQDYCQNWEIVPPSLPWLVRASQVERGQGSFQIVLETPSLVVVHCLQENSFYKT